MTLTIKRVLLTLIILISAARFVRAAEGQQEDQKIDVLTHVQNHYFLDFEPAGNVQLPRIFWDNGSLHFYGSTTAAINSGDGYTDAYYTQDHQPVIENGEVQPVSYTIVHKDGTPVGLDLSISAHLVFFFLSGFIVLIIFLVLNRRYRAGIGRTKAPEGGFQNLMETLVIFVRDEIALVNIGPEKYLKYSPYLLTAFFMILIMNLFSLVPWAASATADVTVTAALAATTFLMTQISGTKAYWKEVFWYPGIPVLVKPIMAVVEFIGLFTKPFALCIRLFANMASGKVLILSMISLIFVFNMKFGSGLAYGTSWIWEILTIFILMIKFLVAFIQAYIFTILSALFIGLAVAEHDTEGAHH